jgi:hypothetical protein
MTTAVLFFLKTALGNFLSLLRNLVAFLLAHPKVLMCVVSLILGGTIGWLGAQKYADRKVAKMQKVLDKAVSDAKEAGDKIKADSKAEADKNEADITALQLKLSATTKNYEDALKANKKLKYAKVVVPGKPETTVDVAFEADLPVCRNYPSTYTEQVNDMVKKTEEALK